VGLDIYEKDEYIKKNMPGEKERHTSAMVIGQGGENKVKYASIMYEDRAAGRGGSGALMGQKNLLGVVVSGTKKVELAKPDEFKATTRAVMKKLIATETRSGMRDYGTVGDLPSNDEDGDFPTKNWRSNSMGIGAEIHDDYYDNIYVKHRACYTGCPIQCGRMVEVKEGPYKTPLHEGNEYETMGAFTAFVMNSDPALATHCGYLCNKYGVDTISTAAVIAFAMDCYEHGVITKEDTGGVAMEWGSPEAILHGIDIIVNRKYIGDLLAEGVRAAAAKLGKGSEEFAVHVKGLEGPVHDPRSGKLLGLTYATGNRGMCHIHPLEGMAFDRGKMTWGMDKFGVRDPETVDRWDEEGKGKDCKILQDGLSAPDVLSTCKFMMYADVTLDDWADMIADMTGWDFDGEELYTVCERVINLQRLFNVREGIGRKDDKLPKRVLSVPEFGAYANEPNCVIQDFESLLDEYYDARMWDKDEGYPLMEKLAELGLEEYAKEVGCYNQ
jgi:aldehyde:ferredoxin oxidoreductase